MMNAPGKIGAAEREANPDGPLAQSRDNRDEQDSNRDYHDAGAGHPSIEINVAHGALQYEFVVPARSTFGELKKEIARKASLKPEELKVLFRGKEMEDKEHLHNAGVKDKAKILVLEDPSRKEIKVSEHSSSSNEKRVEEVQYSEEMKKALQAVAGVRTEVDKLSERIAALEMAVNNGTKIVDKEFDISAELLMRQLLKLDNIEAEGEARLQRKAEVRRVQNIQEALNRLKARNSNPFIDNSKTVSVSTEWETFDS